MYLCRQFVFVCRSAHNSAAVCPRAPPTRESAISGEIAEIVGFAFSDAFRR